MDGSKVNVPILYNFNDTTHGGQDLQSHKEISEWSYYSGINYLDVACR